MFKYLLLLVIAGFKMLCADNGMDSVFFNIGRNYGLTGMSVHVFSEGKGEYQYSYGKRDISRNLPVNSHTKYRIASISKYITAAAVFILADRELLDLDASASDYLPFELINPYFPRDSITVRQLLSHTGSLRDVYAYSNFLMVTYNSNPPPGLDQLLTPGGQYYSTSLFSSKHSPSKKYFQYSNMNYGLLGSIVEAVSGKRFDVFCREEIFVPLQMDADFNVYRLSDINNLAVLYRGSTPQADNYLGVRPQEPDLSQYVIGSNGLKFAPQGGARASAEDLVKFLKANMKKEILMSSRAFDEMHNAVWIYNGSNGDDYNGIFKNYAHGNHMSTDLLPDEMIFGHSGEAYGLIADAYFSLDKEYGIVFITNGGNWGYGNYSAWYDVEEEVFQTAFRNIPHLETGITNKKISNDIPRTDVYPNPFNETVFFKVNLDDRYRIDLKIFDLTGATVLSIRDSIYTEGTHHLSCSFYGYPSGIYIYQISVDDYKESGKLLLVR